MQPNILKKHASLISALVRLIDVVVTVLAGYIAFVYKFSFELVVSQHYLIALLCGCLATIVAFNLLGFYNIARGRSLWTIWGRTIAGWLLIALLLSLAAFLSKTGVLFSRAWFFEWMVIGCFLSCIARSSVFIALRIARSFGYNTRHIIIIGAGELGQSVYRKLCQAQSTGYKVICFLDRAKEVAKDNIMGISILPLPKDLSSFIVTNNIDEVWITLPLRSIVLIKHLMHQLRFSTANIKIVPDIFELDLLNHSVIEVAGIPIINIRATPMEGWNRFVKSFEDKLLSGIIVLLISPILLGIAIAVKCSSPGPVFYRQERVSWNNKTFMMLKFRSMPVAAESNTGAVWAKPGENRATKVGTFLRKTSLDELPQFINVLKGDMSIVGPRPERPVFVEQFKKEIPGYMQKHLVKAGITGWAQINGWRGSTDLNKRIEYDLYYIENWSLWFDLKIIFLTLFKGFLNKNAY